MPAQKCDLAPAIPTKIALDELQRAGIVGRVARGEDVQGPNGNSRFDLHKDRVEAKIGGPDEASHAIDPLSMQEVPVRKQGLCFPVDAEATRVLHTHEKSGVRPTEMSGLF